MSLLGELNFPPRSPKAPKYNQVGYLFFLCNKYGLIFDRTKVESYIASSIYSKIYERLGDDVDMLDTIIENWIPISRALKFKTNLPTNFTEMNIYFLSDNLDAFVVAAKIIRRLSFHPDYLYLKMRMEEECVSFPQSLVY